MYIDLFSELTERPETVELLTILALEACSSSRAELIFTPTPPGIDVKTMAEVIRKLCPLEDLNYCSCEADVRALLDSRDRR